MGKIGSTWEYIYTCISHAEAGCEKEETCLPFPKYCKVTSFRCIRAGDFAQACHVMILP